MVAALLYHNRYAVNERRRDTFTPLLLVASRSDAMDKKIGLIPLDEDTQVNFCKLSSISIQSYAWLHSQARFIYPENATLFMTQILLALIFQVKMIRTLIEYGADLSAKVEDVLSAREYTADDLVKTERYRTRSLLQCNSSSPSHHEQSRRLRQQVKL